MRFIGNVLAGVTSVFYTVVLFAMALVLVISNVFSANYYTEVLKSIDFKEIKLVDLGITDFGEDATVEDVIVDSLIEAGISENDAKQLINNEKINEVAGKLISDVANYAVNPEEVPQLDAKDVQELLEIEEIDSMIGSNEIDAEEITNELNKLIREYAEGELNYDR